mgnify:CR=1 FL=1
MLAACLAPLGLSWLGLWIMGWGLQWILFVADTTAALPGARSFVVQECVTEHCLHAGLRHPIDPDYLQALSQRDYASRFEHFRLRLR